uniref:non-specific serine/threonine protein kinase n=1 Tax=Anisakis simplex TaxID=6269 RepID=A0A158PPB3_ANISI
LKHVSCNFISADQKTDAKDGTHPNSPQHKPAFIEPPPLLNCCIVDAVSPPPCRFPPHHVIPSAPNPSNEISQVSSPHKECKGRVADVTDSWQSAVEDFERDNVIREKIGLIVNKRYQISQKISFGSYGSIYSAVDLHTNLSVAVKFEIGAKQNTDLHLKYENDVYHDIKGAPGVPLIYWFGTEYEHQILVMQLLGPSLEQLFNFCDRTFSCETIVSLGQQMIQRIHNLHSRGFLHRDIKPENFLMGLGDKENICFLVDFGLARRYRFRDGDGSLKHIPFRKGKNLVGTAKYASLNSHNGLELCRRDDLESLGYILIEFINRELPWKEQRSKARFRSKQQSYNRIRNIKEQTDWSTVCPKMAEWIRYCRKLEFSEEPDYDFLMNLLQSLRHSVGQANNPVNDATTTRNQPLNDACLPTSPASNTTLSASYGPTTSQSYECNRPNTSYTAVNGCYNNVSSNSPPKLNNHQWISSPQNGSVSFSSRPNSISNYHSTTRPVLNAYMSHPGLIQWPPSTTNPPPPRFICPIPHYRPFNPGGDFAFVQQTTFHRFPSDTQQIQYPSQSAGGSDSGKPQLAAPLQHRLQNNIGSFRHPFTDNSDADASSFKELSREPFDDGTNRYSWLMRRDSSPDQRYAFDCLFRWTLPPGCEPILPPMKSNVNSFGFVTVRNPFRQSSHQQYSSQQKSFNNHNSSNYARSRLK